MAEKLTVVVTCSDRKSLPVAPSCELRSLSTRAGADRVPRWLNTLNEAPRTRQLRHLYQGEMWLQSVQLESVALALTSDVALLVTSAGLGLRSWDDYAPAYSATFNVGHPDSAGDGPASMYEWWRQLNQLQNNTGLLGIQSSRILLVLSKSYARVLDQELMALGNSRGPSDVILFGGARDIPGLTRVPAEGRLRRTLGGTLMSLNLRMAIRWLGMGDLDSLTSPERSKAWNSWVESAPAIQPVLRRSLTDAEVRNFISQLMRDNKGISRTQALRKLRDSGYACEQRRFASLYELEAA